MSSRSQPVILNAGRGSNVKHPPLAFTEHGAIMAATLLNTPRAVQMTVFVVRAFVKMREGLLVNAVLAREIAALKARMDNLDASTRKQFEQVIRTEVLRDQRAAYGERIVASLMRQLSGLTFLNCCRSKIHCREGDAPLAA